MKNLFLISFIFLFSINTGKSTSNQNISTCDAYAGIGPTVSSVGSCNGPSQTISFNPIIDSTQQIPVDGYQYGILVVIDGSGIYDFIPTTEVNVEGWIPMEYQFYGVSYSDDSYETLANSTGGSFLEFIDSIGTSDFHCYDLTSTFKLVDITVQEEFNLSVISCIPGEILSVQFLGNTFSAGWGNQIIPFGNGNYCSSILHLNVIGDPPNNFYVLEDSLCTGDSLSISAIGDGEYSWTGPNGFTSTMKEINIDSLTNNDFGIYTCEVLTSPNCHDTQIFEVTDACAEPNSIDKITIPFTIFPNPTSDRLFIETGQTKIITVSIYNSLGVLLKTFSINNYLADISLSQLNTGLYFIEVLTEKEKIIESIKKH